jgi:hypothetical protein
MGVLSNPLLIYGIFALLLIAFLGIPKILFRSPRFKPGIYILMPYINYLLLLFMLLNAGNLLNNYFESDTSTIIYITILYLFLLLFNIDRYKRTRVVRILWELSILSALLLPIMLYLYTENDPGVFVIMIPLVLVMILFGTSFCGLHTSVLNDVIELTVRRIRDFKDGYSSRPFATGKLEGTYDELRAFAFRMERFGLARMYLREHDILLLFQDSHWFLYLPFIRPNLDKLTYATIDKDSNVIIHISPELYEKLTFQVSFDSLCRSFTETLSIFFKHYKANRIDLIENMLRWHHDV